MTRYFAVLSLASIALTVAPGAFAAEGTQAITLASGLKIPGATLEAGKYTFSVEDHLQDRAIVRITNSGNGSHYLVLTVPDARIKGGHSGSLIRFGSSSSEASVKAWACPGCAVPLAFVYPKAEAAALTGETAEPILAVDPAYDKLPGNLSEDDMKVVTLWLLSPKEITADHKGEGVTGAKLADARKGTTEVASLTAPNKHLPKTAQDTYLWAVAGIGMLFAGVMARRTGFGGRAGN